MPRGFDDVPGTLPTDQIPEKLDLKTIPFSNLAETALNNLVEATLDEGTLWRDHLSLTGQIRTFYGGARVKQKWTSYSRERFPNCFKASEPSITRPTTDSSWVDVPFTFVTLQQGGVVGKCSGIISFIPSEDEIGWKVWMLRTILENFEGFGHPDDPDDPSLIFLTPNPANKSSEQTEHEVSVVIIGAGQSGLSLAGRLGALNISYILLEKEKEIGYSWTGKYDGIRQHTIREMNNLPFGRTYKASDPNLLPAKTVAEGFQNYVKKYRINIWLHAQVKKCEIASGTIGWTFSVNRGDKSHVIRTKHLVLSMGAGLSVPNPPKIKNATAFKGTILDIGDFKNSSRWKGKKGIVVGSATGAHDEVAQDMLDNGLSSIMMVQRGRTPVFPVEWIAAGQSGSYNMNTPPELADRRTDTTPLKVSREILRKAAAYIEQERFDALERVGFRVDRKAVLNDWVVLRGGGYYIDVGTSARIVNGEIKVKSGDKIKRFVENGLQFESGDILDANVVVFATGYQKDPRNQAATVVGEKIAQAMKISRGLDEEGELDRYMMPVGKRLWLMGGAVNAARWNSRFIALQILAELIGKPFPDCRWEGDRLGGAGDTKL